MEYMLTAYCVVALLSLLIWSITDLLAEIGRWTDRVQNQAWLLLDLEKEKQQKKEVRHDKASLSDSARSPADRGRTEGNACDHGKGQGSDQSAPARDNK